MTRQQAAALAQHAITRSTVPTPLIVRLALWQYARTMNKPAEDAKNAESVRRVK